MAGTTNFIQFNPTAANQETDLAYSGDSQRQNGAINGQLFNDILANKAFYQWSTFITALANALVNKNYSPMDTDINTLESVLANIVTFNDLKSNLSLVAFSPTPTFNATSTNGFDFTLAGNVTGSTLTGQAVGQTITFVITQGTTPYAFVPPSNINKWKPISLIANSVSIQQFVVKSDGTIWPVEPIQRTVQANVTSSRAFGSVYQNTTNYPLFVTGYGHTTTGNDVGSLQAYSDSSSNPTTSIYASTVTSTIDNGACPFSFAVSPGNYYKLVANDISQGSAVSNVGNWTETYQYWV